MGFSRKDRETLEGLKSFRREFEEFKHDWDGSPKSGKGATDFGVSSSDLLGAMKKWAGTVTSTIVERKPDSITVELSLAGLLSVGMSWDTSSPSPPEPASS